MCLFAILIGLKVVEMEYMSQEGYDKLVAELRELELVKLPEVREAIAEARDKGDLSENLSIMPPSASRVVCSAASVSSVASSRMPASSTGLPSATRVSDCSAWSRLPMWPTVPT